MEPTDTTGSTPILSDDFQTLEGEVTETNNQRSQVLTSDTGISNEEFQRRHNLDRAKRDKLYTTLCNTFVSRWQIRATLIEIYKGLFLLLLVVACYLSGKEIFRIVQQILVYSNQSGVAHETLQLQTDSVIAIVTVFVSFTSAIIVLPTQIVKYLFNQEENKDAVAIINTMAQMDTGKASDD